ncbi:Uncharacterised protein [Mycobacteroides abscessus subsp. massiliense]|uniref:Transmembrane protein n=1 Tax=Mycobacteroides abscessus subsp. massiliense TaxID=1962118 RepID=A0A1T8VDH6_9MYCO|nr:Uncharacterised protein [Mycobacteroides abscessus subsp. massiliense]
MDDHIENQHRTATIVLAAMVAGLTLFTIIRWTLDLVIGNDPPMPWWPLGLVVAGLALLRLLHHKDATDDRQVSDSTPPDFSSEIKSMAVECGWTIAYERSGRSLFVSNAGDTEVAVRYDTRDFAVHYAHLAVAGCTPVNILDHSDRSDPARTAADQLAVLKACFEFFSAQADGRAGRAMLSRKLINGPRCVTYLSPRDPQQQSDE